MVLAFGALGPLTLAAAALSRGVLVAAAGVVVVLAILLVFVMVLRGGGSSRQKPSGLDYDAQQGPLGQPHAPANEPGGPPWAGSPMGQMGQMDGQFDSLGQGRQATTGAQQPGWGAQFGEPAQANAWGAPEPAADHWGGQMAPAGGQMGQMGQMGGANDWGAPPSQGRAAANPWDAPAAGAAAPAWNAGMNAGMNAGPAQAPATRPGAPQANPWDAPAQANPWDAPAPSQPQWGGQMAPAAPSQPQWSAQPAAPSQPQWGAQSAAPSQPQWGAPPAAAAPIQPQWGGQPDAGMMYPTTPRGGFGGPRLIERKPDGSGREFDLSKDRLTIGRHRESDVFLEDLAVSRLHTTISRDGAGRYILRDENSANGTYVNGQRVAGDYLLKDGDEVQVGQTTLVFQQR